MSTLKLPSGENLLLAAFHAVETNRVDGDVDLSEIYQQYFTTTVVAPVAQSHRFERFSIIDPNVQVKIQSSTASC